MADGWGLLAGLVVGFGLIYGLSALMDRDLNRRGIRAYFAEHEPEPDTLAAAMTELRHQADEFWRKVLRR